MNEVQQLREQLEESGFTLLEDERVQSDNVLNVEAWVRYAPYALIPIPIRGEYEDDTSYNYRIAVANSSIEELFAQDAQAAVQLSQQHLDPVVEVPFAEQIDEPIFALEPEAEYSIADEDYYAYKAPEKEVTDAPLNAMELVDSSLVIDEEPAKNIDSDTPQVYDEEQHKALLDIHSTLTDALDKLDTILAERRS